ncbi:MAG: YbaB/EbfC family nucleoid-associated protein [Lachnospiraceae bacterium]|nr:YbaB/EbfC family nucleoid-associated protein [Lachnospiraceae bacterium]
MAKRGGYGGGMPGNMNNIMKQAQRMQRQMEEQQKALQEKEFTATAGGGVVTAVVNGSKEVIRLEIDPEVVDPEDVETLEDLVIAALNEAFKKVDEEQASFVGKMTGGIGGLGGGLF